MRILSRGAEAIISLNKNVIKERIRKSYRIIEIDERLRGFRTRREAKILKKLEQLNFPAPRLINSDDKDRLEIEFINGDELKKVLEKSADYLVLSEEIGRKVAILHSNSIIHSDLTTSNMILKKEIYFIDFGLSFFSHKIEDMAVDLHLLNEALKSKHYKIWEECFRYILQGYKKESKRYTDVINRLRAVEKRGRYKRGAKSPRTLVKCNENLAFSLHEL